ncbi:MAG TPA: heavy metal-binding domain-containing protein [Polyangiaceae bacterium]|nr:heavy metal-binding domain-containing protein [Polyangiaceae bacterium]
MQQPPNRNQPPGHPHANQAGRNQHVQYNHELPQHARERLASMRQHHFFTSDLSVNEFLLVKEVGFQPLGLVMGSSIYHVGFHPVRAGVSEELTTLTQALYQARELAMVRMEEEADALGADGIVAVRLTLTIHTWGANIIEFLALGTAVKNVSGEGTWRASNGKPFQSDLSGQDFWTLLHAGYRPVGMVMGNCVYYVAPQAQGWGQQAQQGWAQAPAQNMELAGPTQAFYDARELAMERMQAEAEDLGAEGIVGVTVAESNHTWGVNVLEFSAIGTAVLPIRADHEIAKPQLVLSVNG